jgi:uncharacterized protein YhhL (DUF1145 family)
MTRFLDLTEMVLLGFFVVLNSVTLLERFPGDTRNQIIILVAGILLAFILLIKMVRYKDTGRR